MTAASFERSKNLPQPTTSYKHCQLVEPSFKVAVPRPKDTGALKAPLNVGELSVPPRASRSSLPITLPVVMVNAPTLADGTEAFSTCMRKANVPLGGAAVADVY